MLLIYSMLFTRRTISEVEPFATDTLLDESDIALETIPDHQRPDGVLGEWQLKTHEEQNIHQRIAERTHGALTLANFVSLAGAAVTAWGLYDWHKGREEKAIIKIGVGRILDVADGEIAKRTGTRGKVGAGVDATIDKALTVAATVQLCKDGTLSKPYAAVTILQQARTTVENARIEKLGGEANPSADGKNGMGGFWLGLGSRVAERIARKHGANKVATGLGILSVGAEACAIGFNQRAGVSYTAKRQSLSRR
jgi:phosphatidylglycerophosphate synthase